MLVFLLALACKPIDNDSGTSADDTDVTDTDTDAVDTDTDTSADTDTGTDSDTDVDDTDTSGDTDTGSPGTDADGDGSFPPADCDDADPDVHPGATEVCDDGKDDDCDGSPGRCAFSGAERITDSAWRLSGDKGWDEAGFHVVGGDFDGDGVGDLAVAAPSAPAGGAYRGEVYVVPGPITGDVDLWKEPVWTGITDNEQAGMSLASGDVDGDGVDDIVVGAPTLRPDSAKGASTAGTVYVLTSAASGGSLSSAAVWTRGTDDYGFGSDVAVGDLDGDGAAELVVGSRYTSSYVERGGVVYLFDSAASGGDASDAVAMIYGVKDVESAWGGMFGGAVATPGDLDGDGIGDLVAAAPSYEASYGVYGGVTYVFEGPVSGTMTVDSADARLIGPYKSSSPYEPGCVSSAGDVDGDGLVDLLIGAPEEARTGSDSQNGAVYLVTADQIGGDLDLGAARWHAIGVMQAELGMSDAGADIDGDGFSDVLVGSMGDKTYASWGGAAVLWYGSLSGTGDPSKADAAWYGPANNDLVGRDVTLADVTGDDALDVVVGASTSTGGATSSGSVFVLAATGF